MGFTDVYFCPILANDLAGIFLKMLQAGASGLYHVVSRECTSKYEFGVALARKFILDEKLITPSSVSAAILKAARSPRLTLRSDRLARLLSEPMPDLSPGLEFFHTLSTGLSTEAEGDGEKELMPGFEDSYVGKVRKLVGDQVLIIPAARAVLRDGHQRILLIRRRDNGKWGFPAGAIELGDSIVDCLKREVKEETGLDVILGSLAMTTALDELYGLGFEHEREGRRSLRCHFARPGEGNGLQIPGCG